MSIPNAIALIALIVMVIFTVRAAISTRRTSKRVDQLIDEMEADLRRSKEPTQ